MNILMTKYSLHLADRTMHAIATCVVLAVVGAFTAAPTRAATGTGPSATGVYDAVPFRRGDGSTPLHEAVLRGDLERATLLINAGADVNAANILKVRPLSIACLNSDPAMVKLLLDNGADPNAATNSGETPLLTGAWTGNPDVLRLLLTHGAKLDVREPADQQTPLMWAVAENHLDAVNVLIKAGADVNAVSSPQGFTPLLFAARTGAVAVAKTLLDAGARIDEKKRSAPVNVIVPVPGQAPMYNSNLVRPGSNPCNAGCGGGTADGATPLVLAILMGHVDLAKFLLSRGANPNAGDTGYTPLHYAAGRWNTALSGELGIAYSQSADWAFIAGVPHDRRCELVTALLDRGADINARMTQMPPRYGFSKAILEGLNLVGATPFFLAAYAADVEMMSLLAKRGADISLRLVSPPPESIKFFGFDHGDTTALMAAAGLGRVIGESPVDEASSLAASQWLVQHGADVNTANHLGQTAVLGAARARLDSVVRYLAEVGARLDMTDKAGITPLMAAESNAQFAGRQDLTERTHTGDLIRALAAGMATRNQP